MKHWLNCNVAQWIYCVCKPSVTAWVRANVGGCRQECMSLCVCVSVAADWSISIDKITKIHFPSSHGWSANVSLFIILMPLIRSNTCIFHHPPIYCHSFFSPSQNRMYFLWLDERMRQFSRTPKTQPRWKSWKEWSRVSSWVGKDMSSMRCPVYLCGCAKTKSASHWFHNLLDARYL